MPPTSPATRAAAAFAALVAVCAAAPVVRADATVTLTARSHQAYVNNPIVLELNVTDYKKCGEPKPPRMNGCTIDFLGSSQGMSSSGGFGRPMVTHLNQTFQYSLTISKPGDYLIPPFKVEVDGEEMSTDPLKVTVRDVPQSPSIDAPNGDAGGGDDSSRLLLAEIRSKQDKLFVGEHADFTLTIWIKPIEYGGQRWPASETLRYVNLSGNFGPFDVNDVSTTQAPLRGPNGSREVYYAVELPASMVMDQEGPVDFSEISVAAKYPIRFRRTVFNEAIVTDYQSLHIRPTITVPDVKPLPTEGRPADFSGAVGHYSISVIATPTSVHVGDPIELTITITGDSVETLKQPDLSKMPGMADNFRIADSDLAGLVSGDDKRFKQTIRAKRTDVKEIPPLEFCYFNPDTEHYEVARTQPKQLLVRAVERLDASDLGDIAADASDKPATQLEARDGLLGLKSDESELLAATPTVTQAQVWTFTLIGPIFFCLAWGATMLVQRRKNESAQRKRGALRAAEQRIRQASDLKLSGAEFHSRIESALATYLADRLDEPPAHFLGADATAQLLSRGVNVDLVERYADLLRRCQEAAYSGGGNGDLALADSARQCLHELERERL